jgi:hypothetical protein
VNIAKMAATAANIAARGAEDACVLNPIDPAPESGTLIAGRSEVVTLDMKKFKSQQLSSQLTLEKEAEHGVVRGDKENEVAAAAVSLSTATYAEQERMIAKVDVVGLERLFRASFTRKWFSAAIERQECSDVEHAETGCRFFASGERTAEVEADSTTGPSSAGGMIAVVICREKEVLNLLGKLEVFLICQKPLFQRGLFSAQ